MRSKVFGDRLREIKKQAVRLILPKGESIGEGYWSVICAFSFSYSVGRALIELCRRRELGPSNARILIVGAFGGRDYHWLRGFGYSPEILDLDHHDFAETAYVGDACLKETWDRIQGKFDLIIMCDILEHLPEDYSALRYARTVLKEEGCLFLSLPFGHDREPTHVRNYSLPTLKRLLGMSGFSIASIRYRPGLLEAFPRMVNGMNYILSLLCPGTSHGARLLALLLRAEYVVNDWTRPLYHRLGHSCQTGAVLDCSTAEPEGYLSANRESFFDRIKK